jgi:hypothetical protein
MWYYILVKEYKLEVFSNKILRRIFGHKKLEIKAGSYKVLCR